MLRILHLISRLRRQLLLKEKPLICADSKAFPLRGRCPEGADEVTLRQWYPNLIFLQLR